MKSNKLIFLLIIALAALLPVAISNSYAVNIMVLVVTYCTLSSAWNILSGFAGQFGFSGVFFALGAYVCGGLYSTYGVNPWIGMLIAGCVTAVLGLCIGFITFPLRKTYYALGTLALMFILQLIFTQNKVIFGINFKGTAGLHLKWIGGLGNMQFQDNRGYYYIMLAILILTLVFTSYLIKSKTGFYFKAINTNQMAASSLGVNVLKYKQYAQIITALIMGIVGGVYMMFISSIEPISMFSFDIVFNIMLFAFVGGRATLFGPTVGAVIMMPLYSLLRYWFSTTLPGLPMAIFGLILLLSTQFMPQGIIPLIAEKSRIRKTKAMKAADFGS